MNYDLKDLGLNERFEQEAKFYENFYIGRVSTQHKNMYKVITSDGEINAEISGKLSYTADGNASYPTVGDWVMIDRINDSTGNAIIHHILRRKSVIERKAAGTKIDTQVVAANIDIIFICMSLNNDYNIRRLERYLSIAWDSMATPVVILTKSDLCEDIENKLEEVSTSAPGVDVLITSSLNIEGISDINKYITKGKTVAFVGSSGVGKSTLINTLLGQQILETNEIGENDKGRHTTTYRQLIVLPDGGIVIDTPGMRELQIAGADFAKSFSDIEELASMCKFRDCKHETEPNCAVKKAIQEGAISAERLESFKKLEREAKYSGLNSRQLEHEKINQMFGGMAAMKQAKNHMKEKNKGK